MATSDTNIKNVPASNGSINSEVLIETAGRASQSASLQNLSLLTFEMVCSEHSTDSMKLYCEKCDVPACNECRTKRHPGHPLVPIEKAVVDHKESISKCKATVDNAIADFRTRESELHRIAKMKDTQRKEVHDQIDRSFQMIEGILKTRKKNLNEMLESVLQQRMDLVDTELQAIAEQCTEMQNAVTQMDQLLANDETEELLKSKMVVSQALRQTVTAKPKTFPSELDTIEFYPAELDQVFSHIHRAGLVVTGGVQAANTSVDSEVDLKQCVLHKEYEVNITARDSQHRPVDPSVLSTVNCTASLASPYEKSNFVTVNQEHHQLQIKYQIDVEGTYDMNIKIFGEHIKGSPFTIKASEKGSENGIGDKSRRRSSVRPLSSSRLPTASSASKAKTSSVGRRSISSSMSRISRQSISVEDDLIYKVGGRGRGHGDFNNPQGASVTPDGKILLADSNNANIQVFGTGGEFLLRFGLRGRDPGQLQRPIDICATLSGNYLVSDYDNRCIHVFSDEGKYLSKFGEKRLAGPKGIAVLKDGSIVVVDNKGCCIYIFKSTGKVMHKFGSRGTADHQFAGPHYVAVNSKDHIFVTDFHNHCVKVFEPNGTFLFVIGCTGREAGRFNAPTGIAIDDQDNVIVADWGNSSILIFDKKGDMINSVNTSGDQLYGPQGLAFSPKNQIVVVDTGNHCFKVYKHPCALTV